MSEELERSAQQGGRRRWANVAAIAVLVVLILIFAFQNTEEAEVDWLLWTANGPLIFVILASAAAGFLLGAGLVLLRQRRRRAS